MRWAAILLLFCSVASADDDVDVALALAKAKAGLNKKLKAYDPYHITYDEMYDRIAKKQLRKGIVLVGVADRYVESYQVHTVVPSGFGGFADGEYECFLYNGVPAMQLREAVSPKASPFTMPATGVRPAATSRLQVKEPGSSVGTMQTVPTPIRVLSTGPYGDINCTTYG